ncbi:MAG: OB-fold nucleic acid binding domain-containing protein [Candidatus Woesearchaeota archaeon]|jgi:RPA family protein|nr:OB-fold nucleic acid binding domain-containing protein [Candidatus Woesearchaeota archaeon]MDP7506593.1 OB-fold nucleic acid binding domain-containing protein [Candidatus Woesearchaeota archaeon]MDP7610248.1 OB-fold nucleic acid binding domain-containing protein [Candidatus Woesearchaeota archaeon]|tara:strand:+ start:619 stop:1269 length:651 start_codon:yes stop_codon:yes gene_type:complete
MEEKTFQKREIAYKVRIKDIVEGKYVKNEGWQPNYIITSDSLKVSRINLIGVVISVEESPSYKSFTLDDSTGRISVKIFEDMSRADGVSVGSAVLLIGRPREYGSETYIIPEIIKELSDPKWIMVRKLELNMSDGEDVKSKDVEIEEIKEGKSEKKEDVAERVLSAIKQLDKGEGANFDDVLRIVNENNTDEVIDSLIKQGEIFEPRAGKLIIMNA